METGSFDFGGNRCHFYEDGNKQAFVFEDESALYDQGIPAGWTHTTHQGKDYLTRPIFMDTPTTQVRCISYVPITPTDIMITDDNTLAIKKMYSIGRFIPKEKRSLFMHLQTTLERQHDQPIVPEADVAPIHH